MLSVKWNGRRARIWLNDIPDWSYTSTNIVKHVEENKDIGQAHLTSVALELSFPSGPTSYGGLAVTFLPLESGNLEISIPVLNKGEEILSDILASKTETVEKALPEGYIEGLLRGFLAPEGGDVLGSGKLQVQGALHGYVGSSPIMFSVLGRCVVKLLCLPKPILEEEQAINLLRHEIRYVESQVRTQTQKKILE